TALTEVAVWAPSLRAASIAAGAISKAVAGTLANFNRDSRALPIAPVPTKPIFSIFRASLKQIFTHDRGPSHNQLSPYQRPSRLSMDCLECSSWRFKKNSDR